MLVNKKNAPTAFNLFLCSTNICPKESNYPTEN